MKRMRTYNELLDIYRQSVCSILSLDINSSQVRISYQKEGMPSWSVDDDIVFIRLEEREDNYAKQRNSVYEERDGSVVKVSSRTRVWELYLIVYGPNSYEWMNLLKDGFFLHSTKAILGPNDIYLIPDLGSIQRVPELFDGMWWSRYDMKVLFNELYVVEEDVGAIEHVNVTTTAK